MRCSPNPIQKRSSQLALPVCALLNSKPVSRRGGHQKQSLLPCYPLGRQPLSDGPQPVQQFVEADLRASSKQGSIKLRKQLN
jgi:hypothetical protein